VTYQDQPTYEERTRQDVFDCTRWMKNVFFFFFQIKATEEVK